MDPNNPFDPSLGLHLDHNANQYLNMHNPRWVGVIRFSTFLDGTVMTTTETNGLPFFMLDHNMKTYRFHYYVPVEVPYYLPESVNEPDQLKVQVTLGLSGLVIGAVFCGQTTIAPKTIEDLPKKIIENARHLYGPNLPNCKIWLYNSEKSTMTNTSLVRDYFSQLTNTLEDYPFTIVSPNSTFVAVTDLNEVTRMVSFGDYDTYDLFLQNGPSKWHNADPILLALTLDNNLIPRKNEDNTPLVFSTFLRSYPLHEVNGQIPTVHIRLRSFKRIEDLGDPKAEHNIEKRKRYLGNCSFALCQRALSHEKAKFCSLCRKEIYCARECQVNHWKSNNGHKVHCPRAYT